MNIDACVEKTAKKEIKKEKNAMKRDWMMRCIAEIHPAYQNEQHLQELFEGNEEVHQMTVYKLSQKKYKYFIKKYKIDSNFDKYNLNFDIYLRLIMKLFVFLIKKEIKKDKIDESIDFIIKEIRDYLKMKENK